MLEAQRRAAGGPSDQRVAGSLSLLSASPATAARTEFFGIAQQQLDERDLTGMRNAGVRTDRFELGWRFLEPTQGSFDWTRSDSLIGELASHGIRPVPFVWGSPNWVGSGALAQPPLDSAADQAAWRNFLQQAVARYGPGGTYWSNTYRRQYGTSAKPMPIKSWQIWNEPNLKKYFTPGENVNQSAQKYAELLQISHDAITSLDPNAEIVFAGMPGYGDSKAWVFLDHVYEVPGARSDFDATALHPYARDIDEFRREILQFRASMTNHNDADTPLWLTELAWGSGPPDQFGHNVGLARQQQLLFNSFKLLLLRRSDWNSQRVYWFLWRDPAPGSYYSRLCSICGTAGLLRYNRTPKPAFRHVQRLHGRDDAARVSINSGQPGQRHWRHHPHLRLCHERGGVDLRVPFHGPGLLPVLLAVHLGSPLSDGTHTFFVKAVDAAGNESGPVAPLHSRHHGPRRDDLLRSRQRLDLVRSEPSFSFGSDEPGASFSCQLDSGASPLLIALRRQPARQRAAQLPGQGHRRGREHRVGDRNLEDRPAITSGPSLGSPTNDPSPSFAFSSPDAGRFKCQIDGEVVDADCTSPFTSPVLPEGDHTFAVQQGADTVSREFTIDTSIPVVTVSSGPADGSVTNDRTPSFGFSSTKPGSTFQCRYEGDGFSACSGASSDTAASPLSDGRHSFFVRAIDHAGNEPGPRSTVDTQPPKVRITDAARTTAAKAERRSRATFILQASEHVALRCRIDSRPFKPCSSPYRTPKLTPGTHRLKVKATDEAGNVGTKLKRFKIQRRRPRASTPASVPSHPRCHGIAATLIGTTHGDVLRGTKGRDVIVGFAGNDKTMAARLDLWSTRRR